MAKKQKTTQSGISANQAKQVLDNVFNACNLPSSSIPIELLEEGIRHRRLFAVLTRLLAALALVVAVVFPLLFLEAEVDVQVKAGESVTTVADIGISSIIPLSRVEITLDAQSASYTREGDRYLVVSDKNGELVVSATTWGGCTTVKTVSLLLPNPKKPSIANHSYSDGTFTFTAQKGSFDVDFSGIYALDESGSKFLPSSVDEATGEVVFRQVDGSYNFFVPDVKGNVLQAVLSITK